MRKWAVFVGVMLAVVALPWLAKPGVLRDAPAAAKGDAQAGEERPADLVIVITGKRPT